MVKIPRHYLSLPLHAPARLQCAPVRGRGPGVSGWGGIRCQRHFVERPADGVLPTSMFFPRAVYRLYFPPCRSQPFTSSCCRVSLLD